MCSRCSSSRSWYTASSNAPGRTVSSPVRGPESRLLASALCCLRLGEAVDGHDRRLPSVDTYLAEDGHQRLTERLKRLGRLPDVVDHQITILAEARVMDAPLGLRLAGGV